MNKISLNLTLDKAYLTSSYLVELKSAFLGLCTDIDRYFKVLFDINLNEKIKENKFEEIKIIFPRFKSLNLEQFNRFTTLFINIRVINAHLYLSKPIFLDDDLKEFIKSNIETPYEIEYKNKLTVYGSVIVLSLLSQKYMIWPFVTSLFRKKIFYEVDKDDKTTTFEVNQQKILNDICGIGKPLTQYAKRINDSDCNYINETLKRHLTLIFFDLEKCLGDDVISSNDTDSLGYMLKKNSSFDEYTISKINNLRNCWFHGYFIGDIAESNGFEINFTLKFVLETLKELKKCAIKDKNKFQIIIDDIDNFGKSFIYFYVLRMIEISYKILDKRLLNENKLESRFDNMNKAFKRFNQCDTKLFELFIDLLKQDEIKWFVSRQKFLDKHERMFNSKNLKIIKLHSNNGFKIGEFKTKRKNIVLANVKIEKEFKNLINDIDVEDMLGTVEKDWSRFITIMKVDL